MTTVKFEPQQVEGGGGGSVTKEYVDDRDTQILIEAKLYADTNPEEFTAYEWSVLWA